MSASESGYTIVALPGESDSYNEPRVRSDLAGALKTAAPLVVDLSIAQYEQLERPLLLLLPDDSAPEVHRLFELTGLVSLLPVVRTWDEAAHRIEPTTSG